MLGATNTDPTVFNDSSSFYSERKNLNQHPNFGKGVHFCLGATLERFQVKTALLEIIQKTETIELDDSYTHKMATDRDNGILRFEELFVSFGL